MTIDNPYKYGTFPLFPEDQGAARALFSFFKGEGEYTPSDDPNLDPPSLASDPDFLRGVANVQNDATRQFFGSIGVRETMEDNI
ncbi:MAG TPA: hypothetical protein VJJ78_02620 [Candidatus Saccharimonadales bacterium]|nr:hypothetical protein [Candidatus Saccharimonadales bacterium]